VNDHVVTTLKTQSVLKDNFSVDEIALLAKTMELQNCQENAHIVSEGEPAISLMFILSGEVRVLSKDHQLAILPAGEMFGESLFSDEGIRMTDVIASEETSVAIFTVDHYEQLLQLSSEVALKYKRFFESIYQHRKSQNDKFFYVDPTKYLGLIAHNDMKSSLVGFVKKNIKLISKFPLVATGTTGLLLYKETGIVLSRKVKSGPLGGDQAVGHLISTNNIGGILFFRDPLSSHPHHADIEALGRLCDVYQIPFATNPSTAQAVLSYLSSDSYQEESANNPALEKYQQQQGRVVK
jgi:methylglyoxal synthase